MQACFKLTLGTRILLQLCKGSERKVWKYDLKCDTHCKLKKAGCKYIIM
jgi:hypothetical protein